MREETAKSPATEAESASARDIEAELRRKIEAEIRAELEKEAVICASRSGMIDMYGWLIPAIDGFGLEITLPIVSLMRESVISAVKLKKTCKTWFEKVEELHYFG